MNQSLHLTKDRFAWDHFELCNFKRVRRKQQILSATLGRCRLYRFLKNQNDVNVKSLGYISRLRNNSLHAIKMFYMYL